MGQPVAYMTSKAVATDTHMVLVPTPGGPVPTPLPHPFTGEIQVSTQPTVMIEGQPAATRDSVVINNPPHLPTPPGVAFQAPPNNQGKVIMGCPTVLVGGKPLARLSDSVETCNFPAPLPVGSIVTGAVTVLTG